MFRESLSESFFAGDMAELLKVDGPPAKKKTRSNKNVTYQRLNVELVLHAVGESITSFLTNAATTKRADVALENLAGHISSASLQSWTSQLSKLKSLSLVGCHRVKWRWKSTDYETFSLTVQYSIKKLRVL